MAFDRHCAAAYSIIDGFVAKQINHLVKLIAFLVQHGNPAGQRIVRHLVSAAGCELVYQNCVVSDDELACAVRLRNAGKGRAVFDGELTVNKQIAALSGQSRGISGLAALGIRREVIQHQENGVFLQNCVSAVFHRDVRAREHSSLGLNPEAALLLHHIDVIGNAKGHEICGDRDAHKADGHGSKGYVAVYGKCGFPDVKPIGINHVVRIIADGHGRAGLQNEESSGVSVLSHRQRGGTELVVAAVHHGIALQRAVRMDHKITLNI